MARNLLSEVMRASAEENHMKNRARKTVPLGELVAATFDRAARYSRDPEEVSRLATRAVAHLLRHAPPVPSSPPPASSR
jgi:hypothetical protein